MTYRLIDPPVVQFFGYGERFVSLNVVCWAMCRQSVLVGGRCGTTQPYIHLRFLLGFKCLNVVPSCSKLQVPNS